MSPQIPIVNGSSAYINDLTLYYVDDTSFVVTGGVCADSKDQNDFRFEGGQFKTTFVGVNGCDVRAALPNDLLYVYLIGDSSGYQPNALICSLHTQTPVYPFGYDICRRLGQIKYLGSPTLALVKFQQLGRGGVRTYYFEEGVRIATIPLTTSFVNVPLAISLGGTGPLFSPNGRQVFLDVSYSPAAPGSSFVVKSIDSANTTGAIITQYAGITSWRQSMWVNSGFDGLVSSVANVAVKSAGGNGDVTINMVGYVDDLQ